MAVEARGFYGSQARQKAAEIDIEKMKPLIIRPKGICKQNYAKSEFNKFR
jgi:hypothetical protein